MAFAACKVPANTEARAAMKTANEKMKDFHKQVDDPNFEKLSKDERAKWYDAEIEADHELAKWVSDWCARATARRNKMGQQIDSEVK